MTFYTNDSIEIAFVEQTNFWVLILNGKGIKDARREQTLRNSVSKNSVAWERPYSD